MIYEEALSAKRDRSRGEFRSFSGVNEIRKEETNTRLGSTTATTRILIVLRRGSVRNCESAIIGDE